MTFRVGQKVVCVNNTPLPGTTWQSPKERPDVGAIYTVDGIDVCDDGEPILFLVEIKREPGWGYCVTRFRPIVERKTDISAFHEILRKVTRKSRVDA